MKDFECNSFYNYMRYNVHACDCDTYIKYNFREYWYTGIPLFLCIGIPVFLCSQMITNMYIA